MTRVLFVCLGNICRSPAGEEILRQKAKERGVDGLEVASCGLGDWHVGELPHPPMRAAASQRGYALTSRAQQIHPNFLASYDYILAADHSVVEALRGMTTRPEELAKITLMTSYSTAKRDAEVPDPYFLDDTSYGPVLEMIEAACDGLLDHLDSVQTGS